MKLQRTIECRTCAGKGTVQTADTKGMRSVREKAGISIRGLAKKIDVSAPFLSDVELGRRTCPDYILKAYQKL